MATKLVSTVDRLAELEAEKRKVESEIRAVRAELSTLIPEGAIVGGVRHEVRNGAAVAYARLFEAVLDGLLPKTRRAAALALREDFTRTTERHVFYVA